MTRYYVIAYKCGGEPRNSCILDILPNEHKQGNQYSYDSIISIEIRPDDLRMEDVYPRITKELFESLYGKIKYP